MSRHGSSWEIVWHQQGYIATLIIIPSSADAFTLLCIFATVCSRNFVTAIGLTVCYIRNRETAARTAAVAAFLLAWSFFIAAVTIRRRSSGCVLRGAAWDGYFRAARGILLATVLGQTLEMSLAAAAFPRQLCDIEACCLTLGPSVPP